MQVSIQIDALLQVRAQTHLLTSNNRVQSQPTHTTHGGIYAVKSLTRQVVAHEVIPNRQYV